jgi:tetratricopeptide (TPR) repeat protein
MPQAEDLCKEALEMDPECDVAIATLAQLSLQQGKISEAIDWFEKSAKLARTEVELTTAITCGSRCRRPVECGTTDFASASLALALRRTRFQSAIVVPAGEPNHLRNAIECTR